MSRVVITGAGIVSAAGRGLGVTEAALRQGLDGLGPLTRFSTPRAGGLPVAEVRGVLLDPTAPRLRGLAELALLDAVENAGLAEGDLRRAGLSMGTTVGGMPESEEAFAALLRAEPVDPAVWAHHECGATTAGLMERLGLEGPPLTVSNACASGAQALALAACALRLGLTDTMLAGGADALCRLTLEGFHALLALDPAGCRPFDRQRQGTSLGEGAAFLVLETEDRARARGATVLAELAGWGCTCDAHHPTAPHPEGAGAEAALRAALRAAGLEPGDVGYVNAHGTGTPDNDLVEGRVLRRVLGAPAVSSTKRTFGHTLGAAGAIEAVVCLLALTRGVLPGTVGCAAPDPACEIEPLLDSRQAAPLAALSASFGFGGNDTVLALRRRDVTP